jgi:hypothetical protein
MFYLITCLTVVCKGSLKEGFLGYKIFVCFVGTSINCLLYVQMVWGHRRSQLLEASVNFLCSDTWYSQKSDCPCSSVGVNFVDISRSPLLLIVDF